MSAPKAAATAAEEYLMTHGVEAEIAKAIATVVKQRPDDPCEAIGRLLITASQGAAPVKVEKETR